MKSLLTRLAFCCMMLAFVLMAGAQKKDILWQANAYTVYRDSVVQGKYSARAVSSHELVSDYRSPANLFKSPDIVFKFSINGKDNEMKPGVDHHFVYTAHGQSAETPVVVFGAVTPPPANASGFLPQNAKLKIRVDMRAVLNDLKTKGFYTDYRGDKIYQRDFKGIYVAGNTAPLIWDFDNLVNHPQLQLHDEDGDGIYEVTVILNAPQDEKQTAPEWRASKNVSAFPSYTSGYPISDVLYNLALEEMVNAVEPDSTFRTGKEWAGVWTRDISYSIILSMAHLQPRVAMYSLLRKVGKNKKIIQDTGTGGAWPVSSDRMIWAVAAWELYKVTGDKDWLQQAFTIIKNSIDQDLNTIYDAETGLVRGESSFLDWREQTYPRWMQPVDIAQSECLGTNAVHCQANIVLSKMAALLNQPALSSRYATIAERIKKGINTYLWLPAVNYYGQYRYGRDNKILSPRSEALGEALSVIFGIADEGRAKQVVAHTPVMDFGVPCIYPQIPGIPPYHNNAVWPFVQTFWLWAAVRAGNERSAMASIAAIYRPEALFATNKENFVAENGDFSGTQINSSNMLWSLSGSISIVHKVLFGIRFNENSLSFEPFVPRALAGKRSLDHFIYRGAVLDIAMEGSGNRISRFLLDGKPHPASIPAGLKGHHRINIVLANNFTQEQRINTSPAYTTLNTPEMEYHDGRLRWTAIEGAVSYQLLRNGKPLAESRGLDWPVEVNGYNEYQVIAIDRDKKGSFASEPVAVYAPELADIYEAEAFASKADHAYAGFSGSGFVEISTERNTQFTIPVTVKEPGTYRIDFRYANGNGPTNTENKCAVRTLQVDGKMLGTSLFPQRGKEEWSNWGFSNAITVQLSKGKHTITLLYEPSNENMNVAINQAMIDYVRVIKKQ